MRRIALVAVLCTAVSLPVFAQSSDSSASGAQARPSAIPMPADQVALNAVDLKFVNFATSGAMAEVELGKAAQRQASDRAIKEFARRMAADHGRSNEKLMAIARAKGMAPPASLMAEHQKIVDRLLERRGSTFDQAYASARIEAHRQTVRLMEEQIRAGRDADLKAYASEALPAARHHLQMAEGLVNQVLVGQR
jgi:putative membrane protein